MNISYNPLLKLRVRHDYFPDQDGSVVSLVPTSSTAVTMKQLSIRMVDRGSGVQELFYGTYPPRTSPLLASSAPVQLSFILRPGDPYFFAYTDVPLEEEEPHFYYASNLMREFDGNGVFQLDSSVRLPTYRSVLNQEIGEASTIALKNERGDTIASFPFTHDPEEGDISPDVFSVRRTFQRVEGGPKLRSVDTNFLALPTGKYSLAVDDQEAISFLPLHDGLQRGDLGILSVYLGDWEEHGQFVVKDGEVHPAEYVLSFAARKTLWRYHLIARNAANYTRWQIVNEAGFTPEFPDGSHPPDERTLPNGETAKVITSTTPIGLEKVPGRRLQLNLTQEINGENHRQTIPLPVPYGKRISNQGTNPDAPPEVPLYFSDIFVYL